MAIEPGSIVGGYRIEAVIGRGGIGVVFRATELALDRPVALKLIAPRLAGDASSATGSCASPPRGLDRPPGCPSGLCGGGG